VDPYRIFAEELRQVKIMTNIAYRIESLENWQHLIKNVNEEKHYENMNNLFQCRDSVYFLPKGNFIS
jgi:hypothetical protein